MTHKYDAIIIGAGAAGLMCAYTAAQKGKKILIMDHSTKLAEKIRISGGGRCNFTNIYTKPESYLSNNPHFCISSLSRYTPNHFTQMLDQFNIGYHEKTLGQLFCDKSSQDIIDLFDQLLNQYQVTRKMGVTIKQVEKISSGFEIQTTIGKLYSETLIIASGGLSIPQIGATGFGYNIAKQFAIPVITPKPALVPLALSPEDARYFTPLSGTSFFSSVSTANKSFNENTLLTHRGLSGPAILQISSYWEPGNAITINLLPTTDITALLLEHKSSNKLLTNFLQQFFSERLTQSISQLIQINKPISNLSKLEIQRIEQFIHNFSVKPSGTLGYKKAEVTKGGIDTKFISSKNMESTNIEGLFFIGEVVDVTGWLGGYNFQWAWASGYACGNSL